MLQPRAAPLFLDDDDRIRRARVRTYSRPGLVIGLHLHDMELNAPVLVQDEDVWSPLMALRVV